jgi:hypothetical protein
MMVEPIWADYVVYDEDGYISGVREDAPQNVKDAYNEYVRERERIIQSGEEVSK